MRFFVSCPLFLPFLPYLLFLFPSECSKAPLEARCLGSIGTPSYPYVVLGDYPGEANYTQAKALVLTYLLNNPVGGEEKAAAWEKMLLEEVRL